MKLLIRKIKGNPLIKILFLIFFFITFFQIFCTSEKLMILKYKTGPNLNSSSVNDIEIVKVFKLKKIAGNKLNRDLFNQIYFNGDTLGFRIIFNGNIKNAEIYYVNPVDNTRFPAERIEISNKKIYGFVLLGTMLENFHKNNLNRQIPEDAFCCKDIPYNLEIKVTGIKETLNHRISDKFIIEYLN